MTVGKVFHKECYTCEKVRMSKVLFRPSFRAALPQDFTWQGSPSPWASENPVHTFDFHKDGDFFFDCLYPLQFVSLPPNCFNIFFFLVIVLHIISLQVAIMFISLLLYGFGPIGVDLYKRSSMVSEKFIHNRCCSINGTITHTQ